MIIRYIIVAFLFWTIDREVAYVDLTSHSTPLQKESQTFAVKGGGLMHHGNNPNTSPGTPSLKLHLKRMVVTPPQAGGLEKNALEATIANIGSSAVSIPIGINHLQFSKDHYCLSFTLILGKSQRIGFAEAASTGDDAKTQILLQPGHFITFLLPFATGAQKPVSKEVSASVQLSHSTLEGSVDSIQVLGEAIQSDNSLSLP